MQVPKLKFNVHEYMCPPCSIESHQTHNGSGLVLRSLQWGRLCKDGTSIRKGDGEGVGVRVGVGGGGEGSGNHIRCM